MTNDDRDFARPAAERTARAVKDAKSVKAERDASAKAVLDNMARLKALRLAREAAEPQRVPVPKKANAKAKTPAGKTPALSDWLASQQSGGRRV